MPFSVEVKQRMFLQCHRHCCLCLRQCGTKIEAAHITDEANGGDNTEENGIPLCFDCHQEIGSYNDKHPRGNKFRPDELRSRRDYVYRLVAEGRLNLLRPANLPRLVNRGTTLRAKKDYPNPSVAEVLVAVDEMNHWGNNVLILEDSGWENAFVQFLKQPDGLFLAEYRDGATQLQYRAARSLHAETVKLILLTYLQQGDELMRCAVEWNNITASL